MAKFCSNCGKEINENAVICVHCGVQVNNLEENKIEDKKAKNSFVFGILAFLFCIVPILGFIFSVLGISYGIKGLKSNKNKGMAIGGIVLSILSVLVFIILVALIFSLPTF